MTDVPAAPCPRCAAPADTDARFCVSCGTPLADTAVGEVVASADAAAGTGPDGPRAGLVRCDGCGAPNAPSRPICARCAAPLHEEVPGGDALPDHVPPASSPADGRARDTSPVLLSLVLLAGLVTAGVLLALVTSGVTSPPASEVTEGVALVGVQASSELDEHPASLVIDGDPTTAWNEASPGEGAGEFLVLQLATPEPIRRVLVWNGDQGSAEGFADNGRAARLRVEVGSRQFRADLLDIDGPQAIDLPEPVVASTVRIVVEQAIAGERYTDLAISEIVVEAATVGEGT